MSVLTFAEPKRLGDWLIREGFDGARYARTQVTLLSAGSDTVLTTGMVMGQITASGKYVQINFGASDGSQTAAGILGPDVTVPASVDTQSWVINRLSVVRDLGLTWPGGTSGGNIAAGTASLKALGVLVRTGA